MRDGFLIGGQSNARGRVGLSTFERSQLDVAAAFYSAWPTFAAEYHRLTGREVDLVNSRVGGSAQTREAELAKTPETQKGCWDREGTLWQASVDMVEQLIPEHDLRGILWCQGETDAAAITHQNSSLLSYQTGLLDMIGRYREHFGRPDLPVFIIRSAYELPEDSFGYRQVRTGQERATWLAENVHIAYWKAISFPERGLMVDHVHWNQDALIDVGRHTARYVVPALDALEAA